MSFSSVWYMLWYSKDSNAFLFVTYTMCATASASESNFIIIIDMLDAANQLLVS